MKSGASFYAWLLPCVVACLALAACGRPAAPERLRPDQIDQPSLCALVSYDEATRALGAPTVGATDTSDHGALNPGCSWMGETRLRGATPRMLVFTVWRKSALELQGAAMTGRDLYANEVANIVEEFGSAAPFYGAGDEAQYGAAVANGGALRAKIVVRKGDSVMTMQINGADKASFEDIARKVAHAM
jgi:hypothetical protein